MGKGSRIIAERLVPCQAGRLKRGRISDFLAVAVKFWGLQVRWHHHNRADELGCGAWGHTVMVVVDPCQEDGVGRVIMHDGLPQHGK